MSIWAINQINKHFGIELPGKFDNIKPAKKTAKQIKQETKTINGAN